MAQENQSNDSSFQGPRVSNLSEKGEQASTFHDNADQNPTSQHDSTVLAPTEDWNPGWRFHLAFSCLAVLAMMVSLDGTSVSVALPVCQPSLNTMAGIILADDSS